MTRVMPGDAGVPARLGFYNSVKPRGLVSCLPRPGDDTADVCIMQAKVLPNLLQCVATAGVGGNDCLVAVRVPLRIPA